MVVEGTFTVDQDDFPLSAVFDDLVDVTIELDRVVPSSGGVIPYFWIYSEDSSKLRTDLSEDVGIDQVKFIDTVPEGMYVRIDWNLDHESVLTAITNTSVTLLTGKGSGGQWIFEIRGDTREEIAEFQRYCNEHSLPTELVLLHAISPIDATTEYILTDDQREVLELAYSRGYFDSPRGVDQADIGEELGVTRQAVASRLQRGLRRLVGSTLDTIPE